MNAREQLFSYLGQVERRLRTGALLSGLAALAGVALIATVVLVWITNALAFSPGSLTAARVALFVIVALAIGFGIARPLLRLNRRRAASTAEHTFPQFEQRLLTFTDKDADQNPFLDLLAQDTLDVARASEPASVLPGKKLAGAALAAMGSLGVLLWLITGGPGFWGHGANLLWAGTPKGGLQSFYQVQVTPGDATIRRRTDQLIGAQLVGLYTDKVRLNVRYENGAKWEQVTMQPKLAGSGFEFLLASVPENAEYYVDAGGVKSATFKLRVMDLPRVKNIKVSLKHPAWTGLGTQVEEQGGDLRGVEGTVATLEVETDKPLKDGKLVVDNEKEIELAAAGTNRYTGSLKLDKDGLYHVAIMESGDRVRLTEDYFIEARKESPPTIRISRPGRDFKASPIEEVTVAVEADDDFGLQNVNLHYSVNGGPEQTVAVASKKGAKESAGSVVLALEDHKLVPGDIVSVYATAKDALTEVRTDIFFIEAQPFEKEYFQAQSGGGGGGGEGGDQQNEISKRQKEIIAATWNQQRDKKADKATAAETGKFLSDVQAKLRDQATTLSKRMTNRELTAASESFGSFTKSMEAAAESMGKAVEKLKGSDWNNALPEEQKALQHLLRAEATMRQIQVAFGSRGGGGGGGGAARDLENLFDLELDTEKNQYETGQQSAGGGGNRQKEIDEALQKLEQLARRQQELAQQQRNNKQQTFQQRWQQEMLRREAEELQKQMEQLTRNNSQQGGQPQQGGQSQQGSAQTPQQSAQAQGMQGERKQHSASRTQMDPRVQRAIDQLRQATEDMRKATTSAQNGQQGQQSEAESRRAAERLEQARDALSGMRKEEAGEQMGRIGERAERLARQQDEMQKKLLAEYGNQKNLTGQPTGDRKKNEAIAAERQQMAEELARLEKEMQEAARALGSSERKAAGKLREALGELQQNEVDLRMRSSAELIRRGYGAYAYMREAPIKAALEKMREKVEDAQKAMDGKGGAGGEEQKLEQALNRVEQMRQRLEQAARGQQQGQNGERGQKGQQGQGQQNEQGQGQQPGQGQRPGQGQQGKQGQNGQQGDGQQSAQGGQQGQSGQSGQGGMQGGMGNPQGSEGGRGGSMGGQRETRQGGERGEAGFSAMNTGGYRPEVGGGNGQANASGLAGVERAYREGVRDLSEMRRELRDDADVSREIQDLLKEMQRLDPSRFQGNPQMVEQLRSQVLTGLEQLELQLRRKVEEQNTGQVRSSSSQPVPSGYRESVAEYFRRLSKGK